MRQVSLFTGQPVLSQLLNLIPLSLVERLGREHQADRYCKRFYTYDHVVPMLAGVFMGCTSLRELTTGLQACEQRLRHAGLKHTPRRSTLADANARRPEALFGDLFHGLYRRYYGSSPDSRRKKDLLSRLHILDSTTITLFSDVMHGTGAYGMDGRKKGGAKAHVVMRAQDQVPCFIDLTEGRRNDKTAMASIPLAKGSVLVFDMGYTSFEQWQSWSAQGVHWVTRLQDGVRVQVTEHLPVSDAHRDAGVIGDQLVLLGAGNDPVQARIVHYHHTPTGRLFRFVTNNMLWAPTTIAHIYKCRWDIEQLFKRVKQNYPLRYFLGDSPNAIKIQIWCAFIADLLLKIVRDRVHRSCPRRWSFANIAGLIRIHLHTYIDAVQFLRDPDRALLHYRPPETDPQLPLFMYK